VFKLGPWFSLGKKQQATVDRQQFQCFAKAKVKQWIEKQKLNEKKNVNQKGVNLNKNIKVEIFSLKTNIRKP
jgi:hypothetical protein